MSTENLSAIFSWDWSSSRVQVQVSGVLRIPRQAAATVRVDKGYAPRKSNTAVSEQRLWGFRKRALFETILRRWSDHSQIMGFDVRGTAQQLEPNIGSNDELNPG